MAIRHNHRLHVDFDVKFNPALYATIAQHMNNSIEMPTLQEFMVRDTDIYPHATIPVGKVLVDIEFEQRATSLMLEAERRRHHAIEKKRGERALKRSGEVEGKLSAEQRAKLASKQKSVKDSYEKRRAAKEAEATNPLGEGPSGSSAVNDETNMET
ncbi:hypothetical protein B0H14DRAFT_2827480 [Mycena olivaceomarginata]|nr:hypothetical protein B0H14DRAFT_2827480 [Mycena olivaceomarginata]